MKLGVAEASKESSAKTNDLFSEQEETKTAPIDATMETSPARTYGWLKGR
ncbi:hypothetical protein AKJ09_02619 [Labilithrix luteola]|uniref:Uncharacterized protein n=1 Tax=Labilithrix luteola TaxID=1391654 RepID=A0A0K1PQY7_9BACT|nr:hypothetical protein AKJ09_02619 [Labilithrix luteola]